MRFFHFVCMSLLLACAMASAQTNPIPLINQPLVPASVAPGSGALTLTINGTGFTSLAAVYWNGSLRATTFVSSRQVTVQITAADVATPGVASVTAANLGAGAVRSNAVNFPVRISAKGLGFQPRPVQNGGGGNPVVGDFNDDGFPDFAVTIQNGIQIYLGKGNGTFQPPIATPLKGLVGPIVAGDFNGDGKLDLASTAINAECCSLYLFLGKGNGTFSKKKGLFLRKIRFNLRAAADFNADGKLDLFYDAIVRGRNTNVVLLGNGDGTFSGGFGGPGSRTDQIPAIADYNTDGTLDIALVNVARSGKSNVVVLNTAYPTLFPSTSVAAADVNGDGIVDLVTDGGSVFLGKGDGTFGEDIGTASGINGVLNIGDFNGDGQLDIAVGPSILLGDGKGHFQKPLIFAGLISGAPTTVAGFNGDGGLDLLGANDVAGPLFISVQIPVYFSPTQLDFGSLDVGTTSPPQTATVTNFNTHNLIVSSIAISGTNAPDFAQSNNCGSSLPPSGTCRIQTTFTPSLVQPESADLTLTYKGGSPLTMPLSGIGLPDDTFTVNLDPSSLTFPVLLVGTTSQPQSVNLTNTGNQPVAISSVVATSPFSQTNNCPTMLPVGNACNIQVTFTGVRRGTVNGTLSVTDNAEGSPQTVALTGTATAVVLAPTAIDFGNQRVKTTSVPIPVTLSNLDTTALPISQIQLTGANPGDFQQMNNCGTSVPAQGKCTITVTFTPTAKGARSAQVSIRDDDPTSPQTVPLSGKGT